MGISSVFLYHVFRIVKKIYKVLPLGIRKAVTGWVFMTGFGL